MLSPRRHNGRLADRRERPRGASRRLALRRRGLATTRESSRGQRDARASRRGALVWLSLALLPVASLGCEPTIGAVELYPKSPPKTPREPEPPTIPAPPEPASEIALPPGARIVDLTYPFNSETIYWPTSPQSFSLVQLHNGPTEDGYFYAANVISTPEHGGTHLDAPIHFAEGKSTADTIPLDRLVAPSVVIDLHDRADADADLLIAPEDIEVFESEHGRVAPDTIVLFYTGWGARWPDRKRYLGDDAPGDASNLHFPGLSKEAAETLVERKVAAVGIDTASIDHGPSKDFLAHRALMAADIPAFENVASLERLPETGSLVVALPMKIDGGSGGPLRIIAIVPARSGTGG